VRERNHREIQIVTIALAAIAAVVHLGRATPLYVIADGNCPQVQPSWGGPLPAGFDPNLVAGILIDVLETDAGKFNRVGPVCDPAGFPVDVELVAAPPGMSCTVNVEKQTWTIAGELGPGDYGIVARARNRPTWGEPNEVVVTVYVRVRKPTIGRPRIW
jgi:hypothetical protein